MKINFLKKEKNFHKTNFDFNTNFYWRIVVFITFILVVAAFAFSYHLFVEINQDAGLSNGNIEEQIQTVKKDRIEKDLDFFNIRKQKSNEILNSPSPLVDPSI